MARFAETERKYEVPSGMTLPDADRLFGLAVGSSDEAELDVTYFDTDDLRLARSGVTLRRRAGGDDAGWHLKLPVDADTRDELQLPLGRDTAQPPARFATLTRVYTRGMRLEPVAKLMTKRRRWTFTGTNGHELAELADDQVHGIRLHLRDATAPVMADLRWLGAELAPARDAEVLAARFTAAVDALPTQEVLGPVAGQLTRRFSREQAQGHTRAVGALDSDRYLQLQERLDTLLADPPLTRRGRRRATRELPHAIEKALRRTTARMSRADAATDTDRDAALHEMRKAAKRTRFVLEVAEPAFGKKARKLRKRIKDVQSLLGDHHDTVVARPVLRELGAQAHIDGGNGFSFGILHATEQATARHLEDQLTAAWKRVARRAPVARGGSSGSRVGAVVLTG
jgi:CHAD domain-containing protein